MTDPKNNGGKKCGGSTNLPRIHEPKESIMALGTNKTRNFGKDERRSLGIMRTPLKRTDLRRGLIVFFDWPSTPTGDYAKSQSLRPIGKIVTKEDLPHMGGGKIGIQLLDDPMWVIDPELAMANGRVYYEG